MEDFTRKVSGQDQTDVIRHGLGARGIDFIETDAYNASPSGAYPLYDGHGNMIATLTKQPTNSISLSARRYTDPWGVTRVGASTDKPDQRYCANMGHRQDDESGLTYMRARYFEPTTGRFISEDPARDGDNWFVYAENLPTMAFDQGGRNAQAAIWGLISTFLMIGAILLGGADADIQPAISRAMKHVQQAKQLAQHLGGDWTNRLTRYEATLSDLQAKSRRLRKAKGVAMYAAIIARLMMIEALLIDCDIAADGYGGLETVFGD